MTKKLTPAIDLLIPSATLIKNNLLVFFVLLIVPTLLANIQGPQQPVPNEPTLTDVVNSIRSSVTPFMIVGSVLSLLFFPPLIFASLKVVMKKSISLPAAIRGSLPYYARLIMLLICISLLVAAGLVLFIVPGIMLLRRFVLAPYFMIHNNLGVMESLRTAAQKSAPYAWSIYSIFGIIFLFGIMGSFGVIGAVASAILGVLYSLALPLRFREIIRAKPQV